MITEDAVLMVYTKLKAVATHPVYKYSRPSSCKAPVYYVINSLGADGGMLQTCVVNVNAYCEDVEPGTPDIETLSVLTRLVIATLNESSDQTQNIQCIVKGDNLFEGEQLENHYSNVRLEVKMLNT